MVQKSALKTPLISQKPTTAEGRPESVGAVREPPLQMRVYLSRGGSRTAPTNARLPFKGRFANRPYKFRRYIENYQYSFKTRAKEQLVRAHERSIQMSNQVLQMTKSVEPTGLIDLAVLENTGSACCTVDCCSDTTPETVLEEVVSLQEAESNQTELENTMLKTDYQITNAVRDRYGSIAAKVLKNNEAEGCCATTSCCGTITDGKISQELYQADELEGLPLKAALASLGCGNPTALAELHEGEVVLDLGSGGGIDVLLSARRVGPTGFAYGVDMTDEMLALAQRNAQEAGVKNVAFLKGDIAAIPLPDNSVDVIISNCVINLAANKGPVFREALRVLKPGGRFAVSDIVIHGGLPEFLQDGTALRRDLSSWTGCIAGALTDNEYRAGLEKAGFSDIDLEITRRYGLAHLPQPLPDWAVKLAAPLLDKVVSRFGSTFVRARKPVAA